MAYVCPRCHRIHKGKCQPIPTLEELQESHMRYMKKLFKAMDEAEKASSKLDERNVIYYANTTT